VSKAVVVASNVMEDVSRAACRLLSCGLSERLMLLGLAMVFDGCVVVVVKQGVCCMASLDV
jgi:hypothetical protein